jgi:hypothetical protein
LTKSNFLAFLAFTLLVAPATLQAQNAEGQGIEMADLMRADGKIYVVVSVVLVVLVGLLALLIRIDQRVGCLEKQVPERNEEPTASV